MCSLSADPGAKLNRPLMVWTCFIDCSDSPVIRQMYPAVPSSPLSIRLCSFCLRCHYKSQGQISHSEERGGLIFSLPPSMHKGSFATCKAHRLLRCTYGSAQFIEIKCRCNIHPQAVLARQQRRLLKNDLGCFPKFLMNYL